MTTRPWATGSPNRGTTATEATYDGRNQLLSQTVGGPLRFRGTLNEPGTATVNGQVAHMLSGNTFDATVDVNPGSNTVPIVAQDASGNVTTKSYQVTVAGTAATNQYDANGSLAQRVEGATTTTYEWLSDGRLKRVLNNGSEIARFGYDPLGRRVEKVASGVTTTFTYDGVDIQREVAGANVVKYIHGPASTSRSRGKTAED